MDTASTNKCLIEKFCADLYRRDFEAVGAYFTEDGEYTDVPAPDDDVARGPKEIANVTVLSPANAGHAHVLSGATSLPDVQEEIVAEP